MCLLPVLMRSALSHVNWPSFITQLISSNLKVVRNPTNIPTPFFMKLRIVQLCRKTGAAPFESRFCQKLIYIPIGYISIDLSAPICRCAEVM